MRFTDILLGILMAALWGINFIASKYGMKDFPPILFSCLRFTAVALLTVPFIKHPSWVDIKRIYWVSLLMGVLHFPFAIMGMKMGLDIASTIIAGQLGVPFACMLSVYFFKEKLGIWRTFGLVISFVGIVLIAGTPNVSANFIGFLLVLFGSFNWGAANIQMKRLEHLPIYTMMGWMALLSAPQLLIFSLIVEGNPLPALQGAHHYSMLAVAYSAIGSTICAYGLWTYLLKRYSVGLVAPFSLVVPFFGIGAGQLFFKEPLALLTIVGGIVTVIGVGIIVIRRPKLTIAGEH